MKRLSVLSLVITSAALVSAVACADKVEQSPTSPEVADRASLSGAPAEVGSTEGTAGTTAQSSICISYRERRDSLVAQSQRSPSDAGLKENVDGWNAAVATHCN